MFQGFAPVFDKQSKILILGSFPSVKSRQNNFYYGNKQNRFWSMLEKVFGEKIEDDIDFKIHFLLSHHIALWDIVEKSDLTGSMDSSLTKSNTTISDIYQILNKAQIQKILCNGRTAYNLLTTFYKVNVPCIYLPSTSPANPRYNYKLWEDEIKASML